MLGFRQYYQEFYQSRTFLVTPADEPRLAVRAYRDYHRYVGLARRGMDSLAAQELDQQIGYHLGVYELAEVVSNTDLAEVHWEAFLNAWSSYLYTLHVGDTRRSDVSVLNWWGKLVAGLHFIAKRFECPVADIRTEPSPRCRQVIDRVEDVCCLHEIRHTTDGAAPVRGPSV